MKHNTSPNEYNDFFINDEEQDSRRILTYCDPVVKNDEPPDDHNIGASKRGDLFSSNIGKPSKIESDGGEENLKRPSSFDFSRIIADSKDVEIEFEKKVQKNEISPQNARKTEDGAMKILKIKKLWRKKVFFIIMLVIRFMNLMKAKLISLRIWETHLYQLNIIGDLIFFPGKKGVLPENIQGYEIYKRNIILIARERYRANHSTFKRLQDHDFFSKILKETKSLTIKFFKIIYLFLNFIKPTKKTRVLWDLISMLITAQQLWYIPLISCFPDMDTSSFMVGFQTIPLVIFTFDILFNFISGYYSKGFWIEEKYRVAKHYLKKEFWIDILTIIPLYLIYTFQVSRREWTLIFMIRLLRMKKMFQRTQDHFQLKKVDHLSLLALFALGLKVLFSAHIGACFWHYQSMLQVRLSNEDVTWLFYYKLLDETWLVRYVNCFYFIIVTMGTVGYGDLAPQSPVEKFLICFIVLFGCGQYGYCLNKIGNIFEQMFENEARLQMKIAAINNYMIQKNVPGDIQIKVRRYLEYIDQQEKEGYQNGIAILQSLSKSLKEEVLTSVFTKTIQYFGFLTKNFSEKFLMELTSKMEEISYAPEQLIFKENDDFEKHLFLTINGKIELFFEMSSSRIVFKTLPQNTSFGELSFITGHQHSFSARSLECSQLIRINRDDFFEVLSRFPEDKERFMMIRDSLLLYNDFELSNLGCYSCNKSTHLIKQCPYLTYTPDKDFIIRREIYSKPQKRVSFQRRDKKSLNCLIIKNDLEEMIKMKRKLENNEKISNFFERNSSVETFPIDESISNYDNIHNQNLFIQKRSSTTSLPSQVGILKHYRQSRDFSRDFKFKRSVSFLSKNIEKSIKEENNETVEEELNGNVSSDSEEKNEKVEPSHSLKEEKKDKKLWDFENLTGSFKNLSEKELRDGDTSPSIISLSVIADRSKSETRYDQIKSFRFYFPYNNFEEIINEMDKLKKKKIKIKQFYWRKAIVLNKISKILAKQKRRSRANKVLGKTFNFFRSVYKKSYDKK